MLHTHQYVEGGCEIYVGGDSNVYTFELSGGDTVAMSARIALTADFKASKASPPSPRARRYEIPVKQLSDGQPRRRPLRLLTGPGDYKLVAKYTLSDKDGGRGTELKSEPVKITVTEKSSENPKASRNVLASRDAFVLPPSG